MPFDKLKRPEELWKERRKAVQESLRVISIDELKEMAREHDEEFLDDPSRDEFLRLMSEHPHGCFYHAVPQDGIEIVYCRDAYFGIWFLSGSGMGPLDTNGKRIMKEAIGDSLSGKDTGGRRILRRCL